MFAEKTCRNSTSCTDMPWNLVQTAFVVPNYFDCWNFGLLPKQMKSCTFDVLHFRFTVATTTTASASMSTTIKGLPASNETMPGTTTPQIVMIKEATIVTKTADSVTRTTAILTNPTTPIVIKPETISTKSSATTIKTAKTVSTATTLQPTTSTIRAKTTIIPTTKIRETAASPSGNLPTLDNVRQKGHNVEPVSKAIVPVQSKMISAKEDFTVPLAIICLIGFVFVVALLVLIYRHEHKLIGKRLLVSDVRSIRVVLVSCMHLIELWKLYDVHVSMHVHITHTLFVIQKKCTRASAHTHH